MKHGVLSLCAPWLVFALQAAAGQAPPVVRIPERVQCGLCQISIDTLATLGTIEGPGSLAGEPAAVRLDRMGRYWAVGAQVGVLVFESHGRRVHRVGRRGQGPGEFAYPAEAIPISGDSVVVLDGNRRATVIAPDLQAVRTIPLPYAFAPAIVLRWPDGLVANAIVRTPEGAGWPLHHLSLARPARCIITAPSLRECAWCCELRVESRFRPRCRQVLAVAISGRGSRRCCSDIRRCALPLRSATTSPSIASKRAPRLRPRTLCAGSLAG